MRYVGGGKQETGCLFCNRLTSGDDVASLILHRAGRSFVIMNLFPYNTGHLMIVPNAHIATPEEAEPATLAEMAKLLQPVLPALRRVLNCDGFNVGINVGAVAGAGIAAHLHQHVVPRWTGDANFMPILASTMVMPELIPVTYAKIRAELAREFAPANSDALPITSVVLTRDRERVLLQAEANGARLPRDVAAPDAACWHAAARAVADLGVSAELAGWAGAQRAVPGGPLALTFVLGPEATPSPPRPDAGWRFEPVPAALAALASAEDRRIVEDALANLAPAVTAAPQ